MNYPPDNENEIDGLELVDNEVGEYGILPTSENSQEEDLSSMWESINIDVTTEESYVDESEKPSTEALFTEDKGTYPVEVRKLLVRLLKGPYIDGRDQEDLWATLIRNEVIAKTWLGEVFLTLVIDYDSKIAFTQQLDTLDYKIPVLLRSYKLNFMESILLLFLRQKLTYSGLKGVRAVTNRKEISDWLEFFNKQKQNDPSSYQKQVDSAIKKFADKYNILRKLSVSSERYEISPVLKLILEPETIVALQNIYKELGKTETSARDLENLKEFKFDNINSEEIGDEYFTTEDEFPSERLSDEKKTFDDDDETEELDIDDDISDENLDEDF
ncbi:MAG: DUF4194 domain-containing protein [Endomicrobium sp.]|jgi:hypothetical protein|nr:DUF4194 domain-containing protein [Endomicrobium sp.]